MKKRNLVRISVQIAFLQRVLKWDPQTKTKLLISIKKVEVSEKISRNKANFICVQCLFSLFWKQTNVYFYLGNHYFKRHKFIFLIILLGSFKLVFKAFNSIFSLCKTSYNTNGKRLSKFPRKETNESFTLN